MTKRGMRRTGDKEMDEEDRRQSRGKIMTAEN